MHAKTNSTAFRALTASLVLITASPALAQCPLEEISGASASHFGHAVAVDGTRAAVGAPYEVTGTTGNGVVHSYELLGGTWHETQALTLPSGVSFPEFGIAIAMQGNNLLVGAPKEPNPGSDWQGAVHRYQHDGNAWQYKGELIGFFGGVPGPDFGTALCLDGNLLVTGAPNYLNG